MKPFIFSVSRCPGGPGVRAGRLYKGDAKQLSCHEGFRQRFPLYGGHRHWQGAGGCHDIQCGGPCSVPAQLIQEQSGSVEQLFIYGVVVIGRTWLAPNAKNYICLPRIWHTIFSSSAI